MYHGRGSDAHPNLLRKYNSIDGMRSRMPAAEKVFPSPRPASDAGWDMWMTGLISSPRPPQQAQPQDEIVVHPPSSRAAPANGRRQGQPASARSGTSSEEHPAAIYAESRAMQKEVDKAVKIIRSILQSWHGTLRETFKRVDTDGSGSIDQQEFEEFLRLRLHLRFDYDLMVELMHRFADDSGEITFQSFCELVMGEQKQELGEDVDIHNAKKSKYYEEDEEDVTRDAIMVLRNRIRKRGERLRHIFDDLDRGNQGALSYDDMHFALHLFGVVMPKAQFDTMIRGIDKNYEGVITYPMFLKYFQENTVDRQMAHVRHAVGFSLEAAIVLIRETLLKKVRCDEKELHKAFRVFDRDGNGEVDAKEFGQALLREVGLKFEPDLLAQIIALLDKDGNGTVGFDEFFRYIMGTAVQDLLKFKDAYAKESAKSTCSTMSEGGCDSEVAQRRRSTTSLTS
jgi:Ca2+-binding EF-hand superfamily protein